MFDHAAADLLNPSSLLGAGSIGLALLFLATALTLAIRRNARRLEAHLTDVTALRYISAFLQLLCFLVCFIIWAHLIPELRSLGRTLLAGAGIVSVVIGVAAQNTLGNLVAGLALVLYRPIRVGDRLRVSGPGDVAIAATVESVSLGFTTLRADGGDVVIVPNAVMMGSTVVRLGATAQR